MKIVLTDLISIFVPNLTKPQSSDTGDLDLEQDAKIISEQKQDLGTVQESNISFNLGIGVGLVVGIAIGLACIFIIRQKSTK